MSDKKLVRFSLAALLAALAVPSDSSATHAAAVTKAGMRSDAGVTGSVSQAAVGVTGTAAIDAGSSGAASEVPGPVPGGTQTTVSGGAAKAPGDVTEAGTVGGKPRPVLNGRLVVLDVDEGTFGIEGKNGLFRAPKGTDLADIGGKNVRVHARANGEVSSIEVVTGEATGLDTKPSEPVQN